MKKLFVHMPKCAGTSVRTLLEDNCSGSVERDYDSFFRIPRQDRNSALMECLCNPREIEGNSIIFGHFFPVRYIGSGNYNEFKLVTILRDPITRLRSHYEFWRSSEFPHHYLWRQMKSENWSFEEFALNDEMRNLYAQFFAGIGFSAFSYIGLFENMQQSVTQSFAALGIEVDAHIPIPRENVTGASKALNLSEDLARKLRNHHAEDYLIYEFAKRKFHR